MENKKRNRLILIILIPILFFFILGIFGYLAFKPYSLSGMAMSPKYKNGQIYLSNKLSYAFGSPKRNDVIIFKDSKSNYIYFSRVIALPNEKIKIQDGNVFINGEKLNESYLDGNIKTVLAEGNLLSEGEEYTVPNNSYFVLGDNRNNSMDSRKLGVIKDEDIISKLTGVCISKC